MVAQFDKDQDYAEKLHERRRRDSAIERQHEVQRAFLLEQMDELASDFADHPEQIGHYIADLEAAGTLSVADRGMLFRRIWETMGPAFADQAFRMTERAASDESLAHDIAQDAKAGAEAIPREVIDRDAREGLDRASEALMGLASALGLDLHLRPAPEPNNDDRIVDPDAERAAKTRELLDVLGPQLGIATNDLDVKVDAEAYKETQLQGLYGLMHDGTVFLNPDVYDPETSEGRGLLAHEVSHVAQRENMLRGAYEADPSIAAAEEEADELSEIFGAGGAVSAPLASLGMYDQAACGPRSMQTTPEEPEPTTQVTVEPPVYKIIEGRIEVPNINFPFDEPGRAMQGKAAIDASGYKAPNDAALRGLIETVAAYPEITGIRIESHTDQRGSSDYNMRLSERRARATEDWLKGPTDGGPPLKIKMTAQGFGESRPKVKGKPPEGSGLSEAQHRENRRSEFHIIEVNGRPHSGPFKPTKRVIVQPGRVITRYYDKDGKLIKEETQVDGQGVQTSGAGAGGAGGAGGDGGDTHPAQAHHPAGGGGGGTPAPEPTGQTHTQPQPPSGQHPAAKAPGDSAPKKTGKKKKNAKDKAGKTRYASPALRRVAQPGIGAPALAKPGPGGLTGLSIEQRTRAVGGGELMPTSVRSRFEQAFGQDFSDVRIHRGSTQATSVGATAFARGTDIHFAPGRFDIASQSGLDVLGHELTHIAQQRAGRVSMPQNKGANVNVDRALEAEADLLGARAARGERVSVQGSAAALFARTDTVQYEGGAGATADAEGGAAPTTCDLYIGGQKISARMPAGAQPGEVRVDFAGVAFHGITFSSARVTFDSDWKIERGTIAASLSVGTYIEANDIQLNIERRDVGGQIQGHIEATVRGARLNVSELFDTTIDLTIASDGVSGQVRVDASTPITLGGGITLESGSLTVALAKDGTLGATGTLTGAIEGLGTVTIQASAMSDGHLSGNIRFELTEPKPIPGIEGVTLESGNISGTYTHGQSWTLAGNLHVNIRDWVGADISATYVHQAEGGAAAATNWTLNGHLTQLQPYTIGVGADVLNLENGELDVNFVNGAFVSAKAGVDYSTTTWAGHITADYDVQAQKLNGKADIRLTAPELPLGDTGIRLVSANAEVTLVDNVLTTMTGEAAALVKYQGEDTFRVEGTGLTIQLPNTPTVSGTINMTTTRDLAFGDPAAYNAKVATGATAQLVVADNALQGITGGLAFSVSHGQEAVGDGTIDVSFTGDNAQLNATGTFQLSAAGGFGVPDRVNGPVKLLPGGEFVVTIEANALTTATVRNLTYEVAQKGGTGKLGGTVNGSYHFGTGLLNVTGDGSIQTAWKLAPANGVELTFKEGGTIAVTVGDNVLTRVHGAFEFEATIAAVNDIPEIVLDGHVNGDYSQENGTFAGELSATTRENLTIPMGAERADSLELHQGATVTAKVTDSAPGKITTSFECDYHRAGELFLNGRVEGATYEFTSGDFDFKAQLTLKKMIEKETEDGKWKFVVLPDTSVGVEVAQSKLQVLTGSIAFEVHDTTGALFAGNLTDARVEVEKLNFSGNLDVHLARDIQYPRGEDGGEAAPQGSPPVSLVAKKDVSHVSGKVTNNALATVTAALHFGVKLGGEEYGAGEVGGTWDLTQNRFSGGGSIQLVKDLVLGGTERNAAGDPMATWVLAFPAGQGLNVSVKNNALDEATINLGAKLLHNGEEVANGQANGRYKLGDTDGFNGSVTANVVKDLDWADGDPFHYWIEQGTTATVQIQKNGITSANGAFKLRLDKGGQQAVRVDIAGGYTPGTGFSCGGGITVLNDLHVVDEGAYGIWVAQGSLGRATIAGTTVTSFTGDLTLLVKKGGANFARGIFNINYALSDARPSISAAGTVELLARVDLGGTDQWRFFVDPSTGVEFRLTNNVPEYVKGTINASADFNNQRCISGNVAVTAELGQEPTITAKGAVSVTSEINTGINAGGFKLFIEPGTGANFDVQKSALQTIGGTVNMRLDDTGGPLVNVALNGTYSHTAKTFDGGGSVTLARKLEVGSNADSSYRYFILEGTGAQATITANKLTQIVGSVAASVEDAQGEFLRLNGSVTYRREETKGFVSTTGVKLAVTRAKEMPTTGEWKATLLTTTSGGIVVTDNELVELNGRVDVQVDKPAGTPFAKIGVNGTYTPTGGFNGSGEGELLTEFEVHSMNVGTDTYTLFIVPGTGAHITLAATSVTEIGGSVEAMIRDGSDFIALHATGVTYKYAEKNFSGSGSAEVLHEKQLATYSGQQLWLAAGSGINATVTNNALQKVGGNLQLHLKDEEGLYLTCGLDGTFDAAGGTGFSGKGAVTVTRPKKLAQLNSYSFWLGAGAGAKATIVQNKLTQVNGNVPFQVHDEVGCLIEGSAKGEYKTEEKKFSGSGDVHLGRDIEYQVGTIKLVFKKGSGGNGTVTDNELKKLGGTLDVDIHDSSGPMINVNASGEFDAVTKKLLWVEGGATLLRPIEVGGSGENALVRITSLSGRARVENNELKWCKGGMDFEAPRLMNMKGHVEGGWEATGGNDVFYGSGWVDFTIFDEPAQGRYMKGKCDFTYNKDATWKLGGEVDYQLNEMIGGKVKVSCDQGLDPEISGELRITNVKLIEGRDLFKWEKEFSLLRTTVAAGPVPIAINGGVVVGLNLSMLPLTFSTTIGITGWHPLSGAKAKVPDFTARADLNTGVRFTAALKPYLSVGIGAAGAASAGLRLQGEVGLNVDVGVNPFAELKGAGGAYSGKVGIGLNVVGSGSLGITPQLYAELLGNTWTHDLANITHDLGSLFSLDYNFAFPFGDNPGSAEEGGGGAATPVPAAAQTKQTKGAETRPAMPPETSGAAKKPGPLKGGPDLNQADKGDEAKSKQEGPMASLMQKIDQIQEWGAKVGAVAKVGGELVTMLTFMITIPLPFGIAVAGLYLGYKLISGGLTIEEIKTACTTVWELIQQLGASAMSLLPDWLVALWNQIKGKSLDDLICGLIDKAAGWLSDRFPSAGPVIDVFATMGKTLVKTAAKLIRAIISGSFGFDDFIDLCREFGGAMLGAIAELVGDAVIGAVSDAGEAVYDFVTDPPW